MLLKMSVALASVYALYLLEFLTGISAFKRDVSLFFDSINYFKIDFYPISFEYILVLCQI